MVNTVTFANVRGPIAPTLDSPLVLHKYSKLNQLVMLFNTLWRLMDVART